MFLVKFPTRWSHSRVSLCLRLVSHVSDLPDPARYVRWHPVFDALNYISMFTRIRSGSARLSGVIRFEITPDASRTRYKSERANPISNAHN